MSIPSRDSDFLTIEYSLPVGPDSGNLGPRLVVGCFGDTLPRCPGFRIADPLRDIDRRDTAMLRQDAGGFVGDLGAGRMIGVAGFCFCPSKTHRIALVCEYI